MTYLDITPVTTRKDLPFYDGEPAEVQDGQWAAILVALAAGAVVDLQFTMPGPDWLALAVRGALFAGIPLATYLMVLPGHWRAIFAKVRAADIRTMVLVLAANLVVTVAMGAALSQLVSTHTNPASGQLTSLSAGERVTYFAAMVPQLFGEELFTILLLLATMSLAAKHLHLTRPSALLLGVVTSTLAFAALHLPTYGWNVLQCLAVIGVARLVLLIAYLKTKNIAVSTGSHVLNDWTLFAVGLIGH